jgi:prepilin-type N-terminal cleavage/methylation domain-containing protein
MNMFDFKRVRDREGLTLIELLVAFAIIAIIAAIGVPEFGRFASKNRVRKATNDLLQNMRLARTMAIKENIPYLITFNEAGDVPNSYRIGFDADGDGSLLTAGVDGYGSGPVRMVDLQREYGNAVIFGSATNNGPDEPDVCPACINITGANVAFGTTATPVTQVFNPDGTVASIGSAFITNTARGYTYMLRVSYQSGKFDLWKWDGENDIPSPPVVNNCAASPMQYCAWREVR